MLLFVGAVNGEVEGEVEFEGVMFTGSVNLTSYSHNVFDPSRCRLKISAQGCSLSSKSKSSSGQLVEDLQEEAEASIETEANVNVNTEPETETETYHLNSKGEFAIELAKDTIYQVWIESLDFHMKPTDRFTINSSNVEIGVGAEDELPKKMKPVVIQQGLGQVVSREYADAEGHSWMNYLGPFAGIVSLVQAYPVVGYVLLAMVGIIALPYLVAFFDPEFVEQATNAKERERERE
ncbi:unnamed protein product [Ambrosiozyma monospora]|uniref:Unnamed protein product n=1 Tax=Ambrosiozyma monospora TaxID=43982 RepID=A0A9W6Z442_AMBMO|nr:unnamed protein product [Ambrosiozyma monospora]